MKAQLRWNGQKTKYELAFKGRVLVSSKNEGYLHYLVSKNQHSAIVKNQITDVEVISREPNAPIEMTDLDGKSLIKPTYTVNQRVAFMEQMVDMVVNKSARSIFITGEGGIGKTYTVLDRLKQNGKVNVNDVVTPLDLLTITPDDPELEMKRKALATVNKAKGDYVIIKGRATDAALYRALFENRNSLVVFDDCDSVFKSTTGCSILKSAIDSYDDRWVHWLTERSGEHDLPPCFKFNGSIIFISNTPLANVDEAIKTRCLKVDLSMTKPQRIERMLSVLPAIYPDVNLKMKKEALKLLEDNMHLTDDVNFRSLMSIICIRADVHNKNWKDLATYALTEQ